MLDFPASTVIHRRLPKEAFYKHLQLSKTVKAKFVSDVERIIIENSFTKENLNLSEEAAIKEILLLSLFLKKQDVDGKVLEAIAKQNPYKLVFLLNFGSNRQLAVYHRKLYRTEWRDAAGITLNLQGVSMDAIWEALVGQIALGGESAGYGELCSLEERLALQEQIVKLEKAIERTEKAAWKEQQPKKRFELYSRLREQKRQLELLKNS